MNINLNKPFLNLEGEPIKDENGRGLTIGNRLAVALANYTEGDGMKFYIWAVDIYKGKTFDIDEVDGDLLINFIKEHKELTELEKGQIRKLLKPSDQKGD